LAPPQPKFLATPVLPTKASSWHFISKYS